MMELMREDNEDKFRVWRWCVEKGIDKSDDQVEQISYQQSKLQVDGKMRQRGLDNPFLKQQRHFK